jgi:hypothetical protein
MIMVVSTAALVIVMISLTGSLRTKQTRLEESRIAKNAFEGGLDVVRDMANRGVLSLPQTVAANVGSLTVNMTVTATPATGSVSLLGVTIGTPTPNTMTVAGSVVCHGYTYSFQQIIGRGKISSYYQYALYCDSGFLTLNQIRTGSPGNLGDIWVNGSTTILNGASHIAGDATSTAFFMCLGPVDGQTTQNAPSIVFPTINKLQYTSVADSTFVPAAMNGYTFAAADSTGYPIIYASALALSLTGTFNGNGVIIANRDITITGSLNVTAGSHVLIIACGNITVNNPTSQIDPYIYCNGTLTISGGVQRSFNSGVFTNALTLNGNIQASLDTYLRDNPAEAYKMHVPGFWP